MAVLRLDAALVFDDDDPAAQEVFEAIEAVAERLRTFHPIGGRPQPSTATLHRCYHDEGDGSSCEVIASLSG